MNTAVSASASLVAGAGDGTISARAAANRSAAVRTGRASSQPHNMQGTVSTAEPLLPFA